MRPREFALALAALPVVSAPLPAQGFSARTEVVAASGYLWRGLTRHRTPVLQALGAVGYRKQSLSVDLSAWGSGITGDCGRPACPEGTGVRIADANASLLVRLASGDMRFAVGASAYWLRPPPFDPGRKSAATWEAVAMIAPAPSQHLQIALTTWLDLDEVEGIYAEASATVPITLRTRAPPEHFFTMTLGWNQGQDTNRGTVPGYFARNGLTHVSLEASRLLSRPTGGRGMTVQLFARLQGNLDKATKSPVWPFKRAGADQQVIIGLAVHQVVAAGGGY